MDLFDFYTTEELKAPLREAFSKTVAGAPPFIMMDGQAARNPLLRGAWNLAVGNGWVRIQTVELEQETYMKGYLTSLGKEALGL
jgi:hypothetical protein